MLSYWERKNLSKRYNLLIIGGGIVGLNAAISAKELTPDARILILERGLFPNGASTKNAGFACFGSVSELMDDTRHMSDNEVVELVSARWNGLQLLHNRVPAEKMSYSDCGGWEFFVDKETSEQAGDQVEFFNKLLESVFHEDVFARDESAMSRFGLNGKGAMIHNRFEGQLDPMEMMSHLLATARLLGIEYMTGAQVMEIKGGGVTLDDGLTILAEDIVVATNGFASKLLDLPVKPARAQVLITDPIPDLALKGVFHLDRGYYYFRNVGDRILFGGGRHLDYAGEETMIIENSERIMGELKRILHEHICPGHSPVIHHQWAGIMGVGEQRSPIIKEVQPGIWCAVRLGGMGVALGSSVGDQVAQAIFKRS